MFEYYSEGEIWSIYLILHAEFHAIVKIYGYLIIYKSCQNPVSVLKLLNRQT